MGKEYVYEKKLLDRIDFQQHRPLSEIIYQALKAAILEGSFPLGERINENGLADQLTISRTPVRKAVNRLVKEGLLEYVPNYGAVVVNVSTSKIIEIFKIRQALEKVLYNEVLENITDREIQQLEALCQRMFAVEKENDITALMEKLNLFNDEINRISRMNTLTLMLEELNEYFKNFRDFSFSTKCRRASAVREHTNILNCIKQRDEKMLDKAVEAHIEHSRDAALETFLNHEKYKLDSFSEKLLIRLSHSINIHCKMKDCPIKEEMGR